MDVETKTCVRCKEELPLTAFSKDRNAKDGLNCYCRACLGIRKRERAAKIASGYIPNAPLISPDGTKKCTRCLQVKPLDEFNKRKDGNLGVTSQCKSCLRDYYYETQPRRLAYRKEYISKNREAVLAGKKDYYIRNKEKIDATKTLWILNNREHVRTKLKIYGKEYRRRLVTGSLAAKYYEELTPDDAPEIVDGTLSVACSFCGARFSPPIPLVMTRIRALNSTNGNESRLYCSDKCKHSCPVYNKKPGQALNDFYNPFASQKDKRPLQSSLREMVLADQGHECCICGETSGLICHHLEPVKCNPVESADIDNCVVLCKKCHAAAHSSSTCSQGFLSRVGVSYAM